LAGSDSSGSKISTYLPAGILALLALIWGYTWVPQKIGIPYAGTFSFAALRALLGAIVLLAVLAVLRRPLRPKALGLTLALGVLQTTGFVGLTMWALEAGGAGRTAVLANTMPFWLLIMAWPLLGERLHGLQWASVPLGLAGLVLIIGPWNLHGVASSLLAVGGAISWAAGAIVAKVLRRRHRVDLLSLTAWQMLLGSIPLIVVAVSTADRAPVWSATLVWTLAYAALLATALGWFLWLFVLDRLPAGVAGLGNLGTPVVGVVAPWIQLGERPSVAETAGIVLVLAALGVLVLRGALRAQRWPRSDRRVTIRREEGSG